MAGKESLTDNWIPTDTDNWIPTDTAWRTASGELVQVYRQGVGGWIWACGGCLKQGYRFLVEQSASPHEEAQEHAKSCSAIQV
jgi:hypothetical protein